jgi:hypothetical protein
LVILGNAVEAACSVGLTGDGADDLAVGAVGWDNGAYDGAVFLFSSVW